MSEDKGMKKKRVGSEPGRLAWQGDLTVQNAASVKAAILEAAQNDRLVLDCAGVTEIDVAGLQLLCSAHRTFAISGKQFRLAGRTASFEKGVRESGYARDKGCRLDPDGSCLWVAGGSDE